MSHESKCILDAEFFDLYKKLTTFPRDYDPKDKHRIQIFAERLRHIRETAHERIVREKDDLLNNIPCEVYTKEALAKALFVTSTQVANYEKGNIKSIPMDKLVRLYDIYDVTPHYLTGYTDQPDKIILFNENNEPLYHNDGTYQTGIYPFTHPLLSSKTAIDVFSRLSWDNPKQFITLANFLNSEKNVRNLGFNLLSVILEGNPVK